mgnify:CR=1 FL=1
MMATYPRLAVILLPFIRTVHEMFTQEKSNVLALRNVMKIAVLSVAALAFAAAVKTDTTTT